MYKFYKKNPKKLQVYAKTVIPDISQLFGKRPELYLPGGNWPTYYSKAKGTYVWGIDGKKYIDFTMVGVGTSVLGYADKDMNRVANKVINSGSISTLNPPEEVELAEILTKIHPWANAVKYTRTGGESMSVAIRLARAFTRKEKILFCGYHGWHDWYLSANIKSKKNLNTHLLPGLEPLGVPKSLKNTLIPFRFNSWEDIEKIVKKNAKKCAAIVLEPCRDTLPKKNYLKTLRNIANKNKCVLIFDEITCGWRLTTGGVHKVFKVNPDIAVFGKTIANGVPMGAIIGKKKIISLSKKTFISSVFWTEKIGPACAVAFIKKHKKLNLGKVLQKKGKEIKKIWQEAANRADLNIDIFGIDSLATFKLNVDNWPATITYFIQEMLKKGILASDKCYSNYMHTPRLILRYKKACFEVFSNISKLNKSGNLEKKLEGPIKQMSFSRLTDKK
jgi:glutamate-1-semialdehyde 2,1-aminomutase